MQFPAISGKREVITRPLCLIVLVIFLPECNCFLKSIILLALHCPMVMSFMMNYELCDKVLPFVCFKSATWQFHGVPPSSWTERSSDWLSPTTLTRLFRTAVHWLYHSHSDVSCWSKKALVYLIVPMDTIKCLWSWWLPFSGFLNSPEKRTGGHRNGYASQLGAWGCCGLTTTELHFLFCSQFLP